MKGISAIIATILMLLIALSLAGTAWYYFNVVITSKTGKVIDILAADCTTATNVAVTIKNDGTLNILAGEITVLVDGVAPTGTCASVPAIGYGNSTTCIVNAGAPTNSGTHTVRAAGPANSAKLNYICS